MPPDTSERDRTPDRAAVNIQLLGTVEAYSEGQRLDLGHPMHRLTLAVLVATEGRPVTVESLIDQIWDDEVPEKDLPKKPRDRIYEYISDVRGYLKKGEAGGTELLPQHNGGYRLVIDRRQVDVYRFQDLLADARTLVGHDDVEAVRLFREAFRQWGTDIGTWHTVEPLAGLTGRWASRYRQALREKYRGALVDCLGPELGLGRHNQLIPELAELANTDPPDEQIARLLMLAYYRAGRQADAMQAFQVIRKRLVDEIGAEPGKDLKHLYRLILDQDPSLDLSAQAQGKRRAVSVDDAQAGTGTSKDASAASGVPDEDVNTVRGLDDAAPTNAAAAAVDIDRTGTGSTTYTFGTTTVNGPAAFGDNSSAWLSYGTTPGGAS
jgi:DNA-binding SARP family transcriptional activator